MLFGLQAIDLNPSGGLHFIYANRYYPIQSIFFQFAVPRLPALAQNVKGDVFECDVTDLH